MMPFVPWPPVDDSVALLRALAAGDLKALDTLYRRLAPAVYRYALALSGDAAIAADATHDAFAALTERPQGFNPALCGLALLGSVWLLLLAAEPNAARRVEARRIQAAELQAGQTAVAQAGQTAVAQAGQAAVAPAVSGFVAVASARRWQRLVPDGEPTAAWLVPSDMPRERLAALGLPFDPGRAGETVRAELLLHASGEVLALRVVHR